ncbi:uncharacterized protein LOC108665202, partial [Hyalella azteca]|uniref:Uncharacterized protein LOC108665202 n=1 Tax=Hyalella azteca TaxID=294128 RepID=A0A8B7N2I8_HYAAZ
MTDNDYFLPFQGVGSLCFLETPSSSNMLEPVPQSCELQARLSRFRSSCRRNIFCKTFKSAKSRFYCDNFSLLFLLIVMVMNTISEPVQAVRRPARVNSRKLRVDGITNNDYSRERQRKHIVENSSMKFSENGDDVENVRFSNENHELNLLFEHYLKELQPSQSESYNKDFTNKTGLITSVDVGILPETLSEMNQTSAWKIPSSVPDVNKLPSNSLWDSSLPFPSKESDEHESPQKVISVAPILPPKDQLYHDVSQNFPSTVVLDLTALSEFFPLYRELASAMLDGQSLDRAYRAIQTSSANNVFDVADVLLPEGISRTKIHAAIASLTTALQAVPPSPHHRTTSPHHHNTSLGDTHITTNLYTQQFQTPDTTSSHHTTTPHHTTPPHHGTSRQIADQQTDPESGRGFSLLNPF